MPERLLTENNPELSSYRLLSTHEHDTRSITPFHVTVIEAISGVIGVDPTKTCLELADYTSITTLDHLIEDEMYAKEAHDRSSIIAFRYNGFGHSIMVLCTSTGDVRIFEDE